MGFQISKGYAVIWRSYGVATISRLLKNIGLFCKRALQKRPIFCKRDLQFERAYESEVQGVPLRERLVSMRSFE